MTENNANAAGGKPRVPAAALVILALLGAGGLGFWYLDRASKRLPAQGSTLTPEAKTYVRSRNLELSGVEMKASETYLKQTVVEITGQIANNGSRGIRVVEINCVFYDPYGQVVLRERVPIVKRRMGGLASGERKNFRLPFDTIPESWNQAMPQLVIASILFD